MRKSLLALLTLFMVVTLFGQSPYEGTPWPGTLWQFGADNDVNFTSRVLGWKYDVGPAHDDPGGAAVTQDENLVWVAGMALDGGNWKTRLDDSDMRRADSATAAGITLDPTDIALMTNYSNFRWMGSEDRFRDGASWFRYTVEFEEGIYRFINRGYPNTNGNFNLIMNIRDTATMEAIYTFEWNNLKLDQTIELGQFPGTTDERYSLLPDQTTDKQRWYILDKVLELDGPYIVEIRQNRAGALGGQFSEFTFESLPLTAPTNVQISGSDISGCDGSTTLTYSADPEVGGDVVEYYIKSGTQNLTAALTGNDWTTETSLEVYWPGEYIVVAREQGFVVTVTDTVTIVKTNCDPTPYGGNAQAIPGMVQLELFDVGGDGIAYSEVTSPLVNDLNWEDRDTEEFDYFGADLWSTSDSTPAATDTICLSDLVNNADGPGDGGEWYVYSVNVGESSDYAVQLTYNPNATNTSKKMLLQFWQNDELFDEFEYPVTGTWDYFYGEKDSVPADFGFQDNWHDTTFTNVATLPSGDYQIKMYAGTNNMRLDYLKFTAVDTVTFTVSADRTELPQTVPFLVSANKNAAIYLVPDGTNAAAADIKAAQVAMAMSKGGSTDTLFTDDIAAGNYMIYGIDAIDGLSAGVAVTVNELVLPTLSVAEDSINIGFPFQITMDKDGTIYMVAPDTPADADFNAVALKLAAATSGTAVDISTIGVDLGYYWLYGVDADGIVSEPVQVYVGINISARDMNAASIKIYPTIVENYVLISAPKTAQVRIYDFLGKQVMSANDFRSGQLDVSSLNQGMYIISVTTEDAKKTTRIVKN